MERNSAHGMKSDEKPFFCQIYARFFEGNGTCCDWQVFFFISERFGDFSLPEAITDSHLKSRSYTPLGLYLHLSCLVVYPARWIGSTQSKLFSY